MALPNDKTKQQIPLFSLYLKFRHKYRDIDKPAGCYHFPKDQISNSPYALTFSEWKIIVQCYMKNLLAYLKTGNVYQLPYGLGYWQLIKTRKMRQFLDIEQGKKLLAEGKIEKGTFILNKKQFFNGFYPKLKWWKQANQGTAFKNQKFVKVTMQKPYWAQYWKELKAPETKHWLHNLNEDK